MASQQTLPRQTPPSQDTWPFVYATRPSAAPPGVLAATGQTSGKWLHLFMVGHVVSFRHFIRCLFFSHWRSWFGVGSGRFLELHAADRAAVRFWGADLRATRSAR